MIKLKIVVQDLTDCENDDKVLTLPCNIRSTLDSSHEYVVVEHNSDLKLGEYDDIQKLNQTIDDINAANPGMTMEYLELLFNASNAPNLLDDDFIQKIEEDDFMFEYIGDLTWLMSDEEKAACYLATELKIPFDSQVSKKSMKLIGDDIVDYINWNDVWRQYMFMGFKLVTTKDGGLYIVHI